VFYQKICWVISSHLVQNAQEVSGGAVKLIDKLFWGKRKGKRERGASQANRHVWYPKTLYGRVYTAVIDIPKTRTLMPSFPVKSSLIMSSTLDFYSAYNALNVSQFQHRRINHSTYFGEAKNHINAQENFWNQAKPVLRKYNAFIRHLSSIPKRMRVPIQRCRAKETAQYIARLVYNPPD